MKRKFSLLAFIISLILFQACKKEKETPTPVKNTDPITAGFITNVTEGIAPLALNMTNTSTGATQYTWKISYNQSGVNTCGYYDCSSSDKNAAFNIAWPTSPSFENTASLTMNVNLEAKNDGGSQFANSTIIIKNPKECARNSTATIATSITSSNPYYFYVDNVLKGTISGQSTKSFTVPSGTHTFKVEQVSGYLLYPTVVSTTSTFTTCGNYTWTPAL